MKVILIKDNDAFGIECAHDVNPVVSDIIIGLEQSIARICVLGDLAEVIDGKPSVRDWSDVKTHVSLDRSDIMRWNHMSVKRLFVEEPQDKADWSKHIASWLKKSRSSFAKLEEVAPNLGTISTRVDTGWSEKEVVVPCSNCGTGILGKKRVKGDQAQKFQPKDKSVINIGKKWYCGCTSVKTIIPEIPEAPKKKASIRELWPVFGGGVTPTDMGGTVSVTFAGTPAQVEALILRSAKLLGGVK